MSKKNNRINVPEAREAMDMVKKMIESYEKSL